jgi:hypothetical protein
VISTELEDDKPPIHSEHEAGRKRFSKSYSAFERAALFHDTAVCAYRINDVK